MADLTGPNQAETMLRRVSPEGRALATRERQRRQRRTLMLAGRMFVVALLVILGLVVDDLVTGTLQPAVVAGGVLLFLVIAGLIAWTARERPLAATALQASTLAALPAATAAWIEGHCPALPAPAASLATVIAARLGELTPQLEHLDAHEPAADSVRRLLAVELPGLVDRYRSVPPGLRGQAHNGGQSADAHLVDGLRIVDEEITRMNRLLAAGDIDALATQNRFLELKYQGDEIART